MARITCFTGVWGVIAAAPGHELTAGLQVNLWAGQEPHMTVILLVQLQQWLVNAACGSCASLQSGTAGFVNATWLLCIPHIFRLFDWLALCLFVDLFGGLKYVAPVTRRQA
jgi:hypothetical protein